MGHIRLPDLRMTRRWQAVVEAITSNATAEIVAGRSAAAAEAAFKQARTDPVFLHVVGLLAQLPLAARSPDYLDDLRSLGIKLEKAPTLLELSAALAEGEVGRRRARSDIGELANRALIASLNTVVGPALPTLFGDDPDSLRTELGRHAGGARFAVLGREFFARFTDGVLGYYLSRELAEHQGAGHRFSNEADRAAFEDALSLHCREASHIVEAYAGSWFGKHVYQGNGLTPDVIASFARYSIKNITDELKRRQDA